MHNLYSNTSYICSQLIMAYKHKIHDPKQYKSEVHVLYAYFFLILWLTCKICFNLFSFSSDSKMLYFIKMCIKIIVKIRTFMQRAILYSITYCGWSGHLNNQDYYLLIISGNRYIDPAELATNYPINTTIIIPRNVLCVVVRTTLVSSYIVICHTMSY